jgi:molecular chaperone Hsp33
MKKVRLYGNTLKEQLVASRRDRLHHFTLSGGSIRGVVLNATRMVNEMRWNHELGILETLVLGHAYIGAALMASGLKGGDRLGLQVDCSGPIRGPIRRGQCFRRSAGLSEAGSHPHRQTTGKF